MNQTQNFPLPVIILTAAVMLAASFQALGDDSALGAGKAELIAGPLATVSVDAGSATFSPSLPAHALKLVVRGPNDFYFEELSGSAADILLPLGAGMVDGTYEYELVTLAPPHKRKAADRESARPAKAQRQSGSFAIKGGLGVDNSRPENPPTKDIVETDDLIVQANLCAGDNCINGESFGFDTLRLKENNIRIDFLDTSNSSSFPKNDWRIAINDFSNGGRSYFSIEDSTRGSSPFYIEAGAPTNSVRIDSGGYVGLGTSNPTKNLHVVDGNTPGLRLEQDTSDNWPAQSWGIVGNELSFHIVDYTTPMVDNVPRLPFRIKKGAEPNSLIIDESSLVGINTFNPGAPFHVLKSGADHAAQNSSTVALFQNNSATTTGAVVSIMAGNAGNSQLFMGDVDKENIGRIIYRNNIDEMTFDINGSEALAIESDHDLIHSSGATLSGGAWINASSRALKRNIEVLSAEDAIQALGELAPVSYEYKRAPGDLVLGFIAEDVPEIVATADRKGLSSMDIVAVLTKVVQGQQKTIEALSQRLENIEDVE